MAKAYSYIRCSRPEQLKGDTLRRQLALTEKWCRENSHELDNTIRDLGKSAFRGANAKFGALSEFLQLVEDGKIARGSILVVESLDRLSREAVLIALARLLEIISSGIVIYTLQDKQTYREDALLADPTPLMTSIVIMMRAHDESKTKSERLTEAWTEKRSKAASTGQAMTAICPGWMRLVGSSKNGQYELIEDRAAIVRSMFESTITGIGRREIAKRLNEQRVPTWGLGKKAGRHWHDSYVLKVLGNPATYGRLEPSTRGKSGVKSIPAPAIDGYYPAVIDEATFYSARAAAESRGKGGGRTSAGHRNLLRKIAKCASCGGNLTIIDKGARSSGPKLICSAANVNAGCKDRTYHPYHRVETLALAAVSDRLDALTLSAQERTVSIRMELEGERAKLNDRQSELANLIKLSSLTGEVEQVVAQVKDMQRLVNTIRATVKRLEDQVKAAEDEGGAEAAASFLALQRQLREGEDQEALGRVRAAVSQRLQRLVKKIVVGHGEATVHMSDGGTGYFAGF